MSEVNKQRVAESQAQSPEVTVAMMMAQKQKTN